MDHPHNAPADGDEPDMPGQTSLEAVFDRDEQAVTAGAVVPLEPVLANMRAMAEQIRNSRAKRRAATHQPT